MNNARLLLILPVIIIADILRDIKRDKLTWLGYNAAFDADMMRAWFEKAGDKYFGSWFWWPPIDVMGLAAHHLRDRRHTMMNFRLATVARELGIAPPADLHDAAADIDLTWRIYQKLCHSA